MRFQAVAALALVAAASGAGAQQPMAPPSGLWVGPLVGAYVPLGTQADNYKTNVLVGGEFAVPLRGRFQLVGSFAWAPETVKFSGLATNGADIYTYDAGLQFTLCRRAMGSWAWRPFIGAGGGGTTYHYADTGIERTTRPAGYGALGIEMQNGRVAWNLQARARRTGWASPVTDSSAAVTDLGFSLGLTYRLR